VVLDVNEGAATSYRFRLEMPSLTTTEADATVDAPPQLAARLPAAGTTNQRYSLVAEVAGPWHLASRLTVCAPVTISVDGAGDQQFANFLQEGQPPDDLGSLCIVQGATSATLSVSYRRNSSAVTPLLSDLALPGFNFNVPFTADAELDAILVDGTTLRLGALETMQPAGVDLVGRIAGTRPGAEFADWFTWAAAGTGSVVAVPIL
jgi:hypothetical protein